MYTDYVEEVLRENLRQRMLTELTRINSLKWYQRWGARLYFALYGMKRIQVIAIKEAEATNEVIGGWEQFFTEALIEVPVERRIVELGGDTEEEDIIMSYGDGPVVWAQQEGVSVPLTALEEVNHLRFTLPSERTSVKPSHIKCKASAMRGGQACRYQNIPLEDPRPIGSRPANVFEEDSEA